MSILSIFGSRGDLASRVGALPVRFGLDPARFQRDPVRDPARTVRCRVDPVRDRTKPVRASPDPVRDHARTVRDRVKPMRDRADPCLEARVPRLADRARGGVLCPHHEDPLPGRFRAVLGLAVRCLRAERAPAWPPWRLRSGRLRVSGPGPVLQRRLQRGRVRGRRRLLGGRCRVRLQRPVLQQLLLLRSVLVRAEWRWLRRR